MATLLVVEDEPDLAGLLTAVLELEGHVVVSCSSAQQAISAIPDLRPDLILLDIWMERRWAGLEVLTYLQSMPGLAATPAIIITGRPVSDLKSKQEVDLAREVISKPFDIADLVAAVGRVLS